MWKNIGPIKPDITSLIAIPSPVPDPMVNHDYGLIINFIVPNQQAQFIQDNLVQLSANSNSSTVNSLMEWSFIDTHNWNQTAGQFENGNHGELVTFIPMPPALDIPQSGRIMPGLVELIHWSIKFDFFYRSMDVWIINR